MAEPSLLPPLSGSPRPPQQKAHFAGPQEKHGQEAQPAPDVAATESQPGLKLTPDRLSVTNHSPDPARLVQLLLGKDATFDEHTRTVVLGRAGALRP